MLLGDLVECVVAEFSPFWGNTEGASQIAASTKRKEHLINAAPASMPQESTRAVSGDFIYSRRAHCPGETQSKRSSRPSACSESAQLKEGLRSAGFAPA
jgi:hypothetical protein